MRNVPMHAIPPALRIPDEVLRDLREKCLLPVILQSLFNVGAYLFLYVVGGWIGAWWLWPIIWWFQGFILSGFLGASHDCAHGTFATTPWGNRVAGVLWSSTVLFNFTIYKYYHLEHHKYTSVPGDTEPSGVFQRFWDYLRALPMTGFFVPFWIMALQTVCRRFPHFVRSVKARHDARVDTVMLLAWLFLLSGITALWPQQVLLGYWCPLVLYFPMVFFTSIPEHYSCDEGPDLLRNTRSLSSNFLYRYVFWNGNYHAEHHVYPAVPSYNLPRLHALIGNHFKCQERSYVLFHLKVIRGLLQGRTSEDKKVLTPLKRIDYELYNLHVPVAPKKIGDQHEDWRKPGGPTSEG